MFSMEAFCYHREGLSKFGAPKRPLCFQGGGLKRLQTLTTRSALQTRLQTRRALAALRHRGDGSWRSWKPWSYSSCFARNKETRSTLFPANSAFLVEEQDGFTGVHFDELPPGSSTPAALHLLRLFDLQTTKGRIKSARRSFHLLQALPQEFWHRIKTIVFTLDSIACAHAPCKNAARISTQSLFSLSECSRKSNNKHLWN